MSVSEHMKEKEVSLSQQIRDRLLAGEAMNSSAVAAQYHCSNGLLGVVRKKLEDEGHKFKEVQRREGRRVFTDWKLVEQKKREPKVPTDEDAPVAVEPRRNGGIELPRLGQQVTVCVLSVNDHGVVSVGIRDGGKTWLLQLTGQTG